MKTLSLMTVSMFAITAGAIFPVNGSTIRARDGALPTLATVADSQQAKIGDLTNSTLVAKMGDLEKDFDALILP